MYTVRNVLRRGITFDSNWWYFIAADFQWTHRYNVSKFMYLFWFMSNVANSVEMKFLHKTTPIFILTTCVPHFKNVRIVLYYCLKHFANSFRTMTIDLLGFEGPLRVDLALMVLLFWELMMPNTIERVQPNK